MNDNIWLVIAAYNEEPVIRNVIENALVTFNNIVVVDDCSKDKTGQMVKSTSAWYLRHPVNLGQGAALQTGIDFALSNGAEFIATFDADGQHQIDDVLTMYALIKERNVDIVLGSRFLGHTIGMKPAKRLLLKLATRYTNLVSGVTLTDAHNGLRLLSAKAASVIRIKQNRMAHASEIIELIGRNNISYTECPVTIVYTDYSIAKGQRMSNSLSIVLSQIFSKIHR